MTVSKFQQLAKHKKRHQLLLSFLQQEAIQDIKMFERLRRGVIPDTNNSY
jgi:hypothetical protein